ncbi:MAG: magnesium transporter [Clostridia bacterium]|nr:magnesium transporter [Clostridia bacterium]
MEEKIILTRDLSSSAAEADFEEISLFFEEKIREKRYRELKELIATIPSADMAEIFENTDKAHQSTLFRLMSKEAAADAFTNLQPDTQRRLIESFTDIELSEILEELYIDDTVDLIEEMPAIVVKRILKSSTKEDRDVINTILRYPKHSAGSVMTTEYVRFLENMNVEEALTHIRRVAIDKETIYTCYVTDRDRHLLGVVTAKQLLTAELDTPLTDIMDEGIIYVNTHDDREEVAHKLNRYGFLAMPVADSEGRLVGIITLDDAVDVIKEESEEDFAKMAAITPTEAPYLKTSVIKIWLARLPWLLILMLSSTISSTILGGFEAALPAVLVLFVPMIMGTGGNSGGQSSVTVTRSISLSEIEFSDIGRVFWKELRVGLLSGGVLGVVTFIKVVLIDKLLLNNPSITVLVAGVVALSLTVTIIAAKLIGAILPILAKKIGLDPAVMASPLITTLVDALSLVIYFAVASATLPV